MLCSLRKIQRKIKPGNLNNKWFQIRKLTCTENLEYFII